MRRGGGGWRWMGGYGTPLASIAGSGCPSLGQGGVRRGEMGAAATGVAIEHPGPARRSSSRGSPFVGVGAGRAAGAGQAQ